MSLKIQLLDDLSAVLIFSLGFHREYAFLIHEAVHKKEEPKLPCLHCSNIFPSMKLLKDHNRKEHPESFFRCEQCPRFFASKINLDDHILTHLYILIFSEIFATLNVILNYLLCSGIKGKLFLAPRVVKSSKLSGD
jgi:hypothetical protein